MTEVVNAPVVTLYLDGEDFACYPYTLGCHIPKKGDILTFDYPEMMDRYAVGGAYLVTEVRTKYDIHNTTIDNVHVLKRTPLRHDIFMEMAYGGKKPKTKKR